MNTIRNIWSALANVAESLNLIADTIRSANGRLRESLDHAPPAPQLPHAEVIDQPTTNGASRRTSKSKS